MFWILCYVMLCEGDLYPIPPKGYPTQLRSSRILVKIKVDIQSSMWWPGSPRQRNVWDFNFSGFGLIQWSPHNSGDKKVKGSSNAQGYAKKHEVDIFVEY